MSKRKFSTPEERNEARREYLRVWSLKNRENIREYHRQYRIDNADKLKVYKEEWLSQPNNADSVTKSKQLWAFKNAERVHKSELTRRYGSGAKEHYDSQFARQSGLCAICGRETKRRLHLDHEHTTGKLRGLLCGKCNHLLGNAGEAVEVLEKAIKYLQLWGIK